MEFSLRYNPRILDVEQVETLLAVLKRGAARHPVLKQVRVLDATNDSRLANETVIAITVSRKRAMKDVSPSMVAEQTGELLSSLLDGNLSQFHARVEVRFGAEQGTWSRH